MDNKELDEKLETLAHFANEHTNSPLDAELLLHLISEIKYQLDLHKVGRVEKLNESIIKAINNVYATCRESLDESQRYVEEELGLTTSTEKL